MFTHDNWVRWTTNADERMRRASEALAMARSFDGSTPMLALAAYLKAVAEYDYDVLAAWNAYRPHGLLHGEVLPSEVERIRAKLLEQGVR